jgi:hypothetical protein
MGPRHVSTSRREPVPLDFDTAELTTGIDRGRRWLTWRWHNPTEPFTFGYGCTANTVWVTVTERVSFRAEPCTIAAWRAINGNPRSPVPGATHDTMARQAAQRIRGNFDEIWGDAFAAKVSAMNVDRHVTLAARRAAWWGDKGIAAQLVADGAAIQPADPTFVRVPNGTATRCAWVVCDGLRVGWVDTSGDVYPTSEWPT